MLLDGSQVICKASFQAHAHTTLVSTHVHPPKPREPPGALTVGITIQNQKSSVESVAPSHTLARSVLRTTVWTGLLSHPVHSDRGGQRETDTSRAAAEARGRREAGSTTAASDELRDERDGHPGMQLARRLWQPANGESTGQVQRETTLTCATGPPRVGGGHKGA